MQNAKCGNFGQHLSAVVRTTEGNVRFQIQLLTINKHRVYFNIRLVYIIVQKRALLESSVDRKVICKVITQVAFHYFTLTLVMYLITTFTFTQVNYVYCSSRFT